MRHKHWCSVCGADAHGKDDDGNHLCQMHYARYKRTGGVELTQPKHGTKEHWLASLLEFRAKRRIVHRTDLPRVKKDNLGRCWEWKETPGRSGRGNLCRVWEGTVVAGAARVFWTYLNGRIPRYIRHRCDNPMCFRPAHMIEGPKDTQHRENSFDRARAGNYKLTEADVRAIRAADGTLEEIAKRFGISFQNVGLIRQRKTWAWVE